MSKGFLSRDEILQAQDTAFVDVEVPEWGGTVRIKMMSGAERDSFESGTVSRKGNKVEWNLTNVRSRLVARTAVDGEGKRLFSDQDAEALAEKSGAALGRLFEAARRLNGLTEEAEADAAADFQPGPSGDSTSD